MVVKLLYIARELLLDTYTYGDRQFSGFERSWLLKNVASSMVVASSDNPNKQNKNTKIAPKQIDGVEICS